MWIHCSIAIDVTSQYRADGSMNGTGILCFLSLTLPYLTLSCNFTKEVSVNVTSVRNKSSVGGCYNISSNEYNCQPLQRALEMVSTWQDECTLFKLQLAASASHYIFRPVIIRASVHITSTSKTDIPLVSCKFNAAKFYNNTGGLHTLFFNKSESVRFSLVNFQKCPLPIRIYQSNYVEINTSSFRYFNEAVFDIHNSLYVRVHKCSFTDNSGSGIINEQYRGNTGALSITYNNMESSATNPFVIVSDTNFTNNSADSTDNFLTINQIISSGVHVGSGGGMAVFVREYNFDITATIKGCSFSHNFARFFGGGLYVRFHGGGGHKAYIEDNIFDTNRAIIEGAGLLLVGIQSSHNRTQLYYIKGCKFSRNVAKVGGGIHYSTDISAVSTNAVHIENSLFVGNYLSDENTGFGAALAIEISNFFVAKESLLIKTMKNCAFYGNIGLNSIVSIGFQTFSLHGTNKFVNNTGTSLKVVSATLILHDRVEFINNTAVDGAAMVLLSSSQIKLVENFKLLFEGNKGRFGSSLFVSAVPLPTRIVEVYSNPLCFLSLFSDPSVPPSLWLNYGINITFTRNLALLGSAIYTTSILPCSWASRTTFDIMYFPNWPIFYIRDDNINTAFSDQFNQAHSVVTDPIDLKFFEVDKIQGWPGEKLGISMQAIDELGNPTGSIARSSFQLLPDSGQMTVLDVELDPNTILIGEDNFRLNFVFDIDGDEGGEFLNNLKGNIIFRYLGVSHPDVSGESDLKSLDFLGTNCIGGYHLASTGDETNKYKCQCDKTSKYVLACEDDQDSIIIKDGNWAFHVNESLFIHPCPFGYCRCFLNTSLGSSSCANVFQNSDPDMQCICDRKGILCGECTEGNGVTVLLNGCTSCNTSYISLIPLLIFINVATMMLIILLDKPLPQWCYPVLFYLQVVPMISTHYPVSFITSGKYLLYFSSALSFYFPFDFCIHEGMTALESYGLKFIPGITTVVSIPLALLLRYFISKCIPLLSSDSFNGHGIWTISLLVYTYLFHTSVTTLLCPTLPDRSGTLSLRWYIDGSVQCFRGQHIPVSLFGIFWITLLTLLIPVTVLLTYKRSKKYLMFKQLGNSLKEPFVNYFGFWCGIELFRRLFVAIIIAAFPQNLRAILLFIMVLILLYGYCNPYKKKITNVIEICLLVLLLVLLMSWDNFYFHYTSGTVLDSNHTLANIPSCDNNEHTVTRFVAILYGLHYVPLVVGLCCLLTWIVIKLKKIVLNKRAPKHAKTDFASLNSSEDYDSGFNYVQSTEIIIKEVI